MMLGGEPIACDLCHMIESELNPLTDLNCQAVMDNQLPLKHHTKV